MANRDAAYRPDYAVPPGETVQETLDARGMTQAELAERTGRPRKVINEIVKGKAAITPETALRLEHVLGVPARLWNNLESNYREVLARHAEAQSLLDAREWLGQFPWRMMARWGWIRKCSDDASQAAELLNFFGVASPALWEALWRSPLAAFRQSAKLPSNTAAVAAWLRKGEIEAQSIECMPFNARRFRTALGTVRGLTTAAPAHFVPEVQGICSAAGVAVAFVRELPKCRVSGATRWLTPEKALIQLSLRFKTDDHLWFTFFHEAAHLLRHGKRETFVEDGAGGGAAEAEADAFAADLLIPPHAYKALTARPPTRATIVAQAEDVGICPGIIVGRLQHDRVIPFNRFNDLKQFFAWVD